MKYYRLVYLHLGSYHTYPFSEGEMTEKQAQQLVLSVLPGATFVKLDVYELTESKRY